MSDLGKSIFEESYEQGYKIGYQTGYEQGTLKCLQYLITNKKLSPEKAINLLGVSDEDKPYYLALVEKK